MFPKESHLVKSKFELRCTVYNQLITLVFIFGGILNYYNNLLFDWQAKYNWPFDNVAEVTCDLISNGAYTDGTY